MPKNKIDKFIFKIKEYILFVLGGGYGLIKQRTVPNVLNMMTSIGSLEQVLANVEDPNYKGFIRFGDGEYQIMKGQNISFQHGSEELANDLLTALLNQKDLNIDIAIDIPSYTEIQTMKFYRRFIYYPWSYFYLKNSNLEKKYLYTGFTMPYMWSMRKPISDQDLLSYINKFNSLFTNQKIVLFIGEGIRNKIEYFPFNEAKSFQIVLCPSSHSYSQLDDILAKAETFPKDCLLCFVIGPASKVASYHLMEMGYRCFDLGHYLKDFDLYQKNLSKRGERINEHDYFAPDV